MGIKGKAKAKRRNHLLDNLDYDPSFQEPFSSSFSLSLPEEGGSSPSSSSAAESSRSANSSTPDISINLSMTTPQPFRRLLICSLGNPGKLIDTRHSAGHFILPFLSTSQLSHDSRHGGPIAPGPYSSSYTTTLFQSPTFMNVSGPAISKAWKEYKSIASVADLAYTHLIILHDELEKPLGKIKFKKDGSAAGHRGLLSIKESLPNQSIFKIGVGIGRPDSRDKEDVSDYVLGKLTRREKDVLEDKVVGLVEKMIDDIGNGKSK